MFAKLFNGLVVRIDRAVGAREHHPTFHCDEDEGGKGIDIGSAGDRRFQLDETFAHCFNPALEVLRDQLVCGRIFGIDLESEASEGAAEGAVRHQNALAVSGKDGEDAFKGFRCGGEGGIDDHGSEQVDVLLENCAEQGLFAVEEMIEAAGIDFGMSE